MTNIQQKTLKTHFQKNLENNIYFQNNNEYFLELENLLIENPKGYQQKLSSSFCKKYGKSFSYLNFWINQQLPKLKDEKFTIATKCYWILHGFEDFPKCKLCGKQLENVLSFNIGYPKYCSVKYMNNDIEHKHHVQTSLKNHFKTETAITSPFQISEIRQKAKKTIFEKYGNENIFASEYGKQKIKNVFQTKFNVSHNSQLKSMQKKRAKTWHEKYGNENIFAAKEIKLKLKQTQENKYGCYFCCSKNFKKLYENENFKKETTEKIIQTKRKNGTFNISKSEEKSYEILCRKYGNENIIRQYKSEKYPFLCDFYVKSLDLYIECNFSWTHGGMFFDENNENCIQKLNVWKEKAKTSRFYENALKTWTIRDIKKLKTAQENKLNYKVFWTLDEFENYFLEK